MSNAVWPTLHGLSWTLKKSPSFKTAIQPAVANGYETRLLLGGPDPIFKFELEYTILYAGKGNNGLGQDELSQLEAFFMAQCGSYRSFLLDAGAVTKNPAESFVTDQTLTVNANNCAPLVRTKPATQVNEAIYELALGDDGTSTAPVIKANDTPLVSGTGYNLITPATVLTGVLNANGITYSGYVVQLLSSIGSDRLSADFGWMYRCRFAADECEFDMFHYLLWEAQKIELVGTRVP